MDDSSAYTHTNCLSLATIFDLPTTSTLQLIAGITLLLGDVGFVLLSMGRPEFPRLINHKKKITSITYAPPNPDYSIKSDASTIAAAPMDMQDYYQNLPMHTTLLSSSKSNATVFLGKSSKTTTARATVWNIN